MAQERVCNSCSGALNDDSVFCPACGKSVEVSNEVDCPSCGEKNAHDSKYCDKCGSRISLPVKPQVNGPEQPLTRAQRIGVKRDNPKPNTSTTAEEVRRLRRLHEEMREEERSGARWEFIVGIVVFVILAGFFSWVFIDLVRL